MFTHSCWHLRHSETKISLMESQRKYLSESSLTQKLGDHLPSKLITTKSAPTLGAKLHPLLDDQDEDKPTSYSDLLLAAETLENILIEGTLIGASLRSRLSQEATKKHGKMNTRVLKLVYGTMKCKINVYLSI